MKVKLNALIENWRARAEVEWDGAFNARTECIEQLEEVLETYESERDAGIPEV
jgi:hypothetical protein